MDPKSLPAFPHGPAAAFYERSGMTLRDYFAAKAMQAYIAESFHALSNIYKDDTDRVSEIIAMAAYETANAMLAAR